MKKKLFFFVLLLLFRCGPKERIPAPQIESPSILKKISLPWSADFDTGRLDAWTITNEAPTEESTWKIEQGMLVQGSQLKLAEYGESRFLGTHITAGDVSWGNYTLYALVRNIGNGGFGVLFRYLDQKNYYRLFFLKPSLPGSPEIRLEKCQNGSFSMLERIPDARIPASEETWLVKIQTHNDTLRVFLKTKKLFEVSDSSFGNGKIGFSCFANAGLCIDDVHVSKTPLDSIEQKLAGKSLKIRRDHQSGNYPFAIRGIVFRDKDGNGIQDDTEPGIPDVPVSDGFEVVLTNQYGVYSLKNSAQDAQFVFVSIPANYKKNLKFYALLDDSLGQRTFNFPLVPQKQNDPLPAAFIQITDIHVRDDASKMNYDSLLQKLPQVLPKPQFIFATGDLVETGSIAAQFARYADVIKRSPLPVFSVFGNHDLDNGLNRINNFQHYLGPDYFSLEYANWHLVSFNSISMSEKQLQWLENDLKMCRAGKNIILLQHYPPTREQLDKLAKHNVKAVFYGHWHATKIFEYKGMKVFCTPPFRFGGIDSSPAGFRLITLEREEVTTQFISSQLRQKICVVSPQADAVHTQKQLEILVNIYDFPMEIKRVDFQLSSPNHFNEIGELQHTGDWTWKKSIFESLINGDFNLKLTLTTADQQKIQKEIAFIVQLEEKQSVRANENWPMFKGTADRAGFRMQELTPPLNLKWIAATTGSIDFASPIVVNNMVAIASKDRHNLATNNICAFHTRTGELAWCYETEAAVNHSLAATENQIFGQDMLGNIYAFDLERGELLWQRSLNNAGLDFWIYAAPLVADNRLYVGDANDLAALDVETGTVLWKKKLDTGGMSSCASPSYLDGQLLLGALWQRNNLYALDAQSGEILWENPLPGTHSAPLLNENTAWLPSYSGNLYAINLENGLEKWQIQAGHAWLTTSPSAFNNLIITDAGDGRMAAFHKENGERIWQFQCRASVFPIAPYKTSPIALMSSPMITGGIVYFGATDGYLYALDAQTGALKWEYNLGVPILSTPAISGNALFIGAYDGNLYCFIAKE